MASLMKISIFHLYHRPSLSWVTGSLLWNVTRIYLSGYVALLRWTESSVERYWEAR